jgi:hypothetical protein
MYPRMPSSGVARSAMESNVNCIVCVALRDSEQMRRPPYTRHDI